MNICKSVISIPIVSLLILAGCSTPHSIMQSWVGHREEELFRNWGDPSKTIDNGTAGRIAIYIATGAADKSVKSIYCDSRFRSDCISKKMKEYRKVKIIYISPMGNIYAWKMETLEKASSEHLL